MTDVSIKKTDPMAVVCKQMTGPYELMGPGFAELYAWTAAHRLTPAGPPLAVFITDPGETAPADSVWEIWAPVVDAAGDLPAGEHGIDAKRLPQEIIASAIHRGPYDQAGPVYQAMAGWIADNGFTVVGPWREVYFTGPEVAPEEYVTEIQVPVATA